jgi:hypothetical protein
MERQMHHSKHEVQIYDYLDTNVPLLSRMYDKRVQGYQNMGYQVNTIKLGQEFIQNQAMDDLFTK